MITAKFGDNWKEFAKKMLNFDLVIDIAWTQGRRAIELERELESKEFLISTLKASLQLREYGERVPTSEEHKDKRRCDCILEKFDELANKLVVPNCSLCAFMFTVSPLTVCKAQGYKFACDVYGTVACKNLYTPKGAKSK